MKIGASVNFNNYIAVAQKCGFGMGVVCGEPNVIAKLFVLIFVFEPNFS